MDLVGRGICDKYSSFSGYSSLSGILLQMSTSPCLINCSWCEFGHVVCGKGDFQLTSLLEGLPCPPCFARFCLHKGCSQLHTINIQYEDYLASLSPPGSSATCWTWSSGWSTCLIDLTLVCVEQFNLFTEPSLLGMVFRFFCCCTTFCLLACDVAGCRKSCWFCRGSSPPPGKVTKHSTHTCQYMGPAFQKFLEHGVSFGDHILWDMFNLQVSCVQHKLELVGGSKHVSNY